ncbi:MAG TPA: DoxX family protein [Porticoccaceae bacterium]|jgi:putative oxidoreductase|nr:DoxX family protein [Gammaproteobacteria bacterium]HIL59646.1 DoxX family protein [Porticoccaceae bacterium]
MLGPLNAFVGDSLEDRKNYVWALFRILVSAMFMTHGYSKLFGESPQALTGSGITTLNIGDLISYPIPMDINLLFIAGSIELVGGFFILVGLWTHLVAFLTMTLMLMAYLIAHFAWFPTLNGGEMAALYFLCYLMIFVFGAGPISIDSWLAVRNQEEHEKQ